MYISYKDFSLFIYSSLYKNWRHTKKLYDLWSSISERFISASEVLESNCEISARPSIRCTVPCREVEPVRILAAGWMPALTSMLSDVVRWHYNQEDAHSLDVSQTSLCLSLLCFISWKSTRASLSQTLVTSFSSFRWMTHFFHSFQFGSITYHISLLI